MANSLSSCEQHRWKFFQAGGFEQVLLENASDFLALDQLDPKLWVTLSCPVHGVELDSKTLELIDTDGDGRIRVPEVIDAVKWTVSLLRNPDDLKKRSAELPLSSINDSTPEGKNLLDSAKHILKNLGKEGATVITVEDTTDTEKIFSQTHFNGDGVIPADSTEDPEIKRIIEEIIDCLGAETDRSGKPGITQAKVDEFFSEAEAYATWYSISETDTARVLPLGDATAIAMEHLNAVEVKINDYFARCRVAAFDERSLTAMNRQEAEYLTFAEKYLSLDVEDMAGFPLAKIGVNRPLPLKDGLNPAWITKMHNFTTHVVAPLLGEKDSLTESDWDELVSKFTGYKSWLSEKKGASVEKLGVERIRQILGGSGREVITDLIAKDQMLDAEYNAITSVDKLVRFHRDLYTLLNNFVSFSDFYTRKTMATFQVGTLYLDGRSCELCVRVDNPDKHALLATLSRTYLAYCECTRKKGEEKMTIAAAFTDGDSDFLMVGRNGVFFDRQGNDWDATITKIIEHPISIRQAFWSPYKKIIKLVGEQLEKLAAARAKAVTEKAATGIVTTTQKTATAAPAAPAQPFDIAKFAGIFAAIGLAIGAIGTAIAAVVTGFLQLTWWKMPLVLLGIILLISGPSMIIAWLKLSQRNLGPLLDANGWAVNARAKINIPFGRSLTKMARLPEKSERLLHDPFAEKKRRWPYIVLGLIAALVFLYFLIKSGLIFKLIS